MPRSGPRAERSGAKGPRERSERGVSGGKRRAAPIFPTPRAERSGATGPPREERARGSGGSGAQRRYSPGLKKTAAAHRKPNSVPRLRPPSRPYGRYGRLRRGDDHSSSPVITDRIKRPTRKPRTGRPMGPVAGTRASLFGLAPCGVLPATPVAKRAVRSYRTFSPLLVCPGDAGTPVSGVFSVPLSFELPRPGVTRRTTLWSSDFPPPPSPAFAGFAGYGETGCSDVLVRDIIQSLPRRRWRSERRRSKAETIVWSAAAAIWY